MLKPYSHRAKTFGAKEDSFNFYLSRHRTCIERDFGLLVARWGILWRPLTGTLQNK